MKMVHVTIHTADIEGSIGFYRETAGLEVVRDLRPSGKPIVFMAEDKGDTAVELIEDPARPYSGSGISAGFSTEDVEAKRKELIAAGCEPTEIISPGPGTRFFFVTDPNGFTVQFIEE